MFTVFRRSGPVAGRKGCWQKVTEWACMAPRWPQVCLYLYSNLIHLLQFPRPTARASLLFLLGTVSVTSKPSIFSFGESCHLSQVYQMALLTRKKARAQAAPCWSQLRHQLYKQLYFVSTYLPRHKAHNFTEISPNGRNKGTIQSPPFRNRHLPPVFSASHGGKNHEYFTKLFQKMLC